MIAMDAFENMIASILQRQGYRTLTSANGSYEEEKRAIGRHSAPRWELDIVAYRGRDNELLIFECKSLLDSPGVECSAFIGGDPLAAKRYKMFCNDTLRDL